MENLRKLENKELKKLKEIELKMLIEFDNICKKNNIKYILCGGTLIGAIRHKGFIPWDDDIDVLMLRKDYNKFFQIQKKELHKNYYFQGMENEEKCITIFSKIRRKDSIYAESISDLSDEKQGIWIDIFPADNISDNPLIAKYYMFRVIIIKILLSFKNGNNTISKSFFKQIILKILKFISKFYKKENLKTKLIFIINKFNNEKTNSIASYGGCYLFKEILKREYLEDLTEHRFENHYFYIPKKYDEFLKNYYGDYMKLPPKDKQISNHLISKLKFPEEK